MPLSKQKTFALFPNVIGSEMLDTLCRSFIFIKTGNVIKHPLEDCKYILISLPFLSIVVMYALNIPMIIRYVTVFVKKCLKVTFMQLIILFVCLEQNIHSNDQQLNCDFIALKISFLIFQAIFTKARSFDNLP